jgi:hypothetical protein
MMSDGIDERAGEKTARDMEEDDCLPSRSIDYCATRPMMYILHFLYRSSPYTQLTYSTLRFIKEPSTRLRLLRPTQLVPGIKRKRKRGKRWSRRLRRKSEITLAFWWAVLGGRHKNQHVVTIKHV